MEKNETKTSFYKNDYFIIEEIFDGNLQPNVQFAVLDRIKNKISYKPEIELASGEILKPIDYGLIGGKMLLLPSSSLDYTDETELISEIETFIKEYLDLPHPFYYKLVAHYVLLTWVYDQLPVVPYLRAIGDYGTGKTRFAQVIGSICYKSLFLAGATSDAFIFRMIELFKGTLILNELERVNTDLRSQLVVILNNGYEKGLPVGRVEGEKKREPKVFDVFSPKVITTREKFKDLALESRILSIPMTPTKRKDIPILLREIFWIQAERLRNKLLKYRLDKLVVDSGFKDKTEKLSKVEPRLKQTLLPLLSVVRDEVIEREFIKYALEFQNQIYADRSLEVGALIAEKLLILFEKNPKLSIKEVTDAVNNEFSEKEKLTSKAVGQKIRGFGFVTKRSQGTYKIIPNSNAVENLKDRYGLNKIQEESPLSPPSHPTDSNSKGDLGDKGDLTQATEEIFETKALKMTEAEILDFEKHKKDLVWLSEAERKVK